MRIALHDGWTLRAVEGTVPEELRGRAIAATVPGCVHTDLLAERLIPDPYLDDNERLLQWIGRTDWRYETRFNWDPAARGEHVDLVCEGLDTVALLEVNGEVVASTQNMHRTYRFDVSDHLRPGENLVAVTFASAVRYANWMSLELGARPHALHHPFNAIRKMACNFGWDWGPDLVTAGIWRPIGLHSWSTARLAAVRPLATVEAGVGRVAVHVDVQRADGDCTPLTVRARVGDNEAQARVESSATSTVLDVAVPDALLWWPHGYGDQPLYDVLVELAVDDTRLEWWQGRVGFRTVRLDTIPDEHGTSFVIVVNDQPIFVRGANWIPDDAFVTRVTRDRYAARVAQSKDASINLLRVWGGGIYESDEFYDVCDEAWCGSLAMARSSFDGRVAVATDMQLSVAARDSATIALPADVATPEDESSELIVVHVGTARALWFFREDRDQALPAPAFEVSCKAVTSGYQVRVTARSLLRDLTILADRVAADARVDEMLVTLLPGESAVFNIETVAQVDPGSFADPSVLRSANQLITG